MAPNNLSNLATKLIHVFENRDKELNEEKITVNDLLSKVASFYEKFRTAMDYGSEETIPRRAIERMLKRMLFLEERSQNLAEGLVRELIWAGYFPNATVPQSLIEKVSTSINLCLKLKDEVIRKKVLSHEDINEFILQILSCDIFYILISSKEKDAVANFMFRILKESIHIEDDTEQTRDIQVFIAIRKAFARDDLAFLRYKLFLQIFGKITEENYYNILENFEAGYKEIKYQLSYPRKEKILTHIKKSTPAFLILFDLLNQYRGNFKSITLEKTDLKRIVFDACDRRYKNIKRKVRTAIVRSFVFILITKAVMALAIEGTFESIFLGKIQWFSMFLNTAIPPIIMVLAGIGIHTPNTENSAFILKDIHKILFDEKPEIAKTMTLRLKKKSGITFKDSVFSILWILSIFLMFGIIWFILGLLSFNILSKFIFIFFVAIISFLAYRIYQTAKTYTVYKKQNILTPIFEFFFIPIVGVGRSLTEGITQINFILITIDFVIEAPLKGLIGFFEQWFVFVAGKREELE